jgi:hypothetical protein
VFRPSGTRRTQRRLRGRRLRRRRLHGVLGQRGDAAPDREPRWNRRPATVSPPEEVGTCRSRASSRTRSTVTLTATRPAGELGPGGLHHAPYHRL